MTKYTKLLSHLDRPGAYKGRWDEDAAKAIRALEVQLKYEKVCSGDMARKSGNHLAEVEALQKQHEDLVTRNAFLRERPDLPVDRIPVYERMREQIDELEEQVKYKQAQYDSMFRTMVEAGKKIIRLEVRIAELEGAEA